MKIILCGPVFPEEVEKRLLNVSRAAGGFLRNLIESFKTKGISINSATFITYPVEDNNYAGIYEFYNEDDVVVIKNKTIATSCFEFQRSVKDLIDEESVIIFYNMCYAYFGLADYVNSKGGKSILMLADHTRSKEQKNFARKIYSKLCEIEFKKFSKIITLSSAPNIEFSNAAIRMVMHGGIKISNFSSLTQPMIDGELVIMYSGLLSHVTGVDTFLQAIKRCKLKNIKFKISGTGEMEEVVRNASLSDSRIIYLGYMDNDEYIKELSSSNILINPRNMMLDQNQNNFPSKVLDYLATGRVIISTRFQGYEDFTDNIEFYDGDSVELEKKLSEVVGVYDEIYLKTFNKNIDKAKEYDWNKQVDKIINFIEE